MGNRHSALRTVASAGIAAAVLVAMATSSVVAQAAWTVTLFVDPFPSPYQSDWETNPNISTLTIVNPTGMERDVRLIYQVVNTRGQLLANGRSDPLGIPPGAPTVFTSYIDLTGSSSRDRATQDQMERTGRVPEGSYQACVTMADGSGFVLGESCADFTIVYPDPPMLLAPGPDEAIATQAPLFQWTPIQVPPGFDVRYVLQVAEQLPNQTAEEALRSTIPHFQAPDIDVTNFQYPVDGQPFEPGKRYVWRVLAIDQNGFPPAANDGASEIRWFRFDDGTGTGAGQRTALTLSLTNDLDQEPEDASTMGDENGTPTDVANLCASWNNPPSAIAISSASPFGLKRFRGQPAVLYRDSTAVRWWLATTNPSGRRDVLVGGDCKGTKTRVRYIASKNPTVQERINTMLAARPPAAGPVLRSGDSTGSVFGMVVLALGKETVEAPADFAEGQAFLAGRSLEVAPGLNLFAVLGLRDWGLWWLFESMGFQEKEVELTGFLGWDASWNIGGAVGDKAGADLSTERKFLVLRADLPKRVPVGKLKGLFQWSRLAIEISVGDSIGRAFGPGNKESGYSLDVIGKVIHTIQINDELSVEGSIGLDWAREAKKPIDKEVLGRWDWLRGKRRSLVSVVGENGKIGKFVAPPDFEEPEVGTTVTMSYGFNGRLSSIWRSTPVVPKVVIDGAQVDVKIGSEEPEKGKSRGKVTVALSGTLKPQGTEALVKMGISKEFTWGPDRDTVALRDSVMVKEMWLKAKRVGIEGKPPDCGGFAARDDEVCKALRDWSKARKELDDERNPSTSWRARLSAGFLPLKELLDLINPWGGP
jgi:hypothetical protein